MLRIGLLAALLLTAIGCGNSDPCASAGCPNDAKQSASEYQSCVNRHNADRNKKCYQEGVNYELCVQASTVCDSNGRTDVFATFSNANNRCDNAQQAQLCCASSFFCK